MNIKKTLCGLSVLLLLAGCSANKTSENIKVERFDDKIVINIEGKGEYEYIYSEADNENLITVIKESNDDKLKVEINEDGTVSLTVKDIPNGASLILNEVNNTKEENGLVGKWELIQKISNPDVELEEYLKEASVETADKLPIETIVEVAKNMEPYQRGEETLTFYEDGKLDVWQEGFNGFFRHIQHRWRWS